MPKISSWLPFAVLQRGLFVLKSIFRRLKIFACIIVFEVPVSGKACMRILGEGVNVSRFLPLITVCGKTTDISTVIRGVGSDCCQLKAVNSSSLSPSDICTERAATALF